MTPAPRLCTNPSAYTWATRWACTPCSTDIRHVQMMGRVMSGKGGDIIMETASRVMDEEYPDVAFRPEAPDEKTRRVARAPRLPACRS